MCHHKLWPTSVSHLLSSINSALGLAENITWKSLSLFLAATKQLNEWYFLSVCPSVCPSVTPFLLCSHYRIIMKFSGVITRDQGKVHAKGQGQRSKVKVTEVTTQLHGAKNRQIWPRLGVSGLQLQFEFTNGYEMIHKAWSSIEKMPYCFWGSSVKFLGHTAKKIVDFDPNWAFPDCNSNLNSPKGMKWCTKLEVA